MPSQRRNIVASIAFTVCGGPAIVLVFIPWIVTRFRMPAGEPYGQIGVAVVLIAAGLAPLFESIVRFVVVGRGTLVPAFPTERLVVSGLYRFVRNPMYVGVLTALAGEALLFRSSGLLVEIALVWLGAHLFVCFYEERTLGRHYGEEYQLYRRQVPRWIPRVPASQYERP